MCSSSLGTTLADVLVEFHLSVDTVCLVASDVITHQVLIKLLLVCGGGKCNSHHFLTSV